MPTPLWIIDAFTDRPFSGNPAAVCLLEKPVETPWLQALAAEMNLSETAFLWEEGEGYQLRWFTPTVEVDLCGHATLASAHFLLENGVAPERLRFQTRSGELTTMREGDALALNFPQKAVTLGAPPAGLLEALGVAATATGFNRMDWLVEVADETTVRGCAPDFATLKTIPARGVIVTAPAAPGSAYDFVSRFFAPAAGVDEDPVTGSAHCALLPYWAEKGGRDELIGYQASARGGTVRVRRQGDRALLIGRAVTVVRGTLAG